MTKILLGIALVLAVANRADAYPQFQLSRDTSCTGCHIAPDGGGILSENGIATAEQIAWKGGNGKWMYSGGPPSWLQLGGDVRSASGYINNGASNVAIYPMQAEVAANATKGGFSLHLVGGLRRPQTGGSALHVLWSREHYAMWQQKPGETEGLYVRVGRLMPTFGLRLAEHVAYTQRFGGRPLYAETYAAAVSFVTPKFEIHGTAFAKDPIGYSVEQGNGAAVYVESRIGEIAAVGFESKYSRGDDVHRTFAGLTGKLYLSSVDVMVLGEAQVIRQKVVAGAGDTAYQLAAYVLASKPLEMGFMIDGGVGHYTQDTREMKGLSRDCIDANLHWFMTAHVEMMLTGRIELLDLGSGPNGGYALAQIHYRL